MSPTPTEISEFEGSTAIVGVMLSRVERGNLHLGFGYKYENELKYLHLGFQDVLRTDWTWPGLWCFPDVEREYAESLIALCNLIKRVFDEDKVFPYGIGYNGASFDPSGHLILGPEDKGLTCASFVLAVCESSLISLVDASTWIVRKEEDLEFVNTLEEFCRGNHFEILVSEASNGVIRIRPGEVMAACTMKIPPPAKFGECVEEGARIVRRL